MRKEPSPAQAQTLKTILRTATMAVARLLTQKWLMELLKDSRGVSLQVDAGGSFDRRLFQWRLEQAGRGAFYERKQSSLINAGGFTLREGQRRSSQWALLQDGRLLWYGFAGSGVPDWEPKELGYRGERRKLSPYLITSVGVLVGTEGKVADLALPRVK